MSEAAQKPTPPKPPAPSKADGGGKPKAPAKPKAADGEKKERAPRQDYGYRKGAVIRIVGSVTTGEDGKETVSEPSYSGQRLEWYESLQKFDGKVVQDWEESRKGTKNGKGVVQSPRGWLRFYVLDGTIKLEGGEEPAPKKAKTGGESEG